MVFDFEVVQAFLHSLGCEVCAIVRDERIRDPITGDDIVPDELLHYYGRYCLVRGRLYPLGKVVDRHKNEAMTIGGYGMDSTDDINPPSGEGPR